MSLEEKYNVIHAAVSDLSAYQQRLGATNFDSFLRVLVNFVGGVDTQTNILKKQVDIATKKMRGTKSGIPSQLRAIYERSKVLGKPTDHLKSEFWAFFQLIEKDAFASFEGEMSLVGLHHCMDELIDYASDENSVLHTEESGTGEKEEIEKVLVTMMELIKHQYRIILQQRSRWQIRSSSFVNTDIIEVTQRSNDGSPYRIMRNNPFGGNYQSSQILDPTSGVHGPTDSNPFYWRNENANVLGPSYGSLDQWTNIVSGKVVKSMKNPDLPRPTWSNLSPDDWMTIVNSFSVLMYEKHFAENFGPEWNELDMMKTEITLLLASDARSMQIRKDYLSGAFVKGIFTPKDKTKYSLVRQIELPESLANPEHWAHLAWKYCQFKKRLYEAKKC